MDAGIMTTITHSDIAQALQQALEQTQASGDDEIDYSFGITTRELGDHLGISQTCARGRIRQGVEAGIVEYGGRQTRRSSVTGEISKPQVWRIRKDEDE